MGIGLSRAEGTVSAVAPRMRCSPSGLGSQPTGEVRTASTGCPVLKNSHQRPRPMPSAARFSAGRAATAPMSPWRRGPGPNRALQQCRDVGRRFCRWPRRRRRRDGFISFNCAHCGAAGYVHDHGCAAPDPVKIARFQAEAAEHARLHKGSRGYPAALIAAYGIATETVPGGTAIADDAVMGVHITRLLPDGSWRDRGDDPRSRSATVSGRRSRWRRPTICLD
jgi:hypothetical protein